MNTTATNANGIFGVPFAAEASALAAGLRRSVVLVDAGRGGHGSGVFWESPWPNAALVLTNDHVLVSGRPSDALVELEDGRRLAATVSARDARRDLAALRVPLAPGLPPPVPIGDANALRVGEIVVAVGNPWGVRGAATLGIVSGSAGGEPNALLQADVALAPGNSGGLLADARGRVVGIACMIVSPGIALAVPTSVVAQFLAEAFGAGGPAVRRAA